MDEMNLNQQDQELDFPVSPEPEMPAADMPSPEELDESKPIVPKRTRKPNPQQVFKEERLPFLILGVAALLCVIFIFGSISRNSARTAKEAEQTRITELLNQEAEGLKTRAAKLAAEYNYEDAMRILASYSGGLANEPSLKALYEQYKAALADLVVWDDLSQIPNLSFRTLVADLDKATADPDRGSRFGKNYITTGEFSDILQQLYDNGYVLVSLYDFAAPGTAEDGSVTVTRRSIRLPAGKKPVILTLEGANYYSYMDACGGFASRLVLDESGKLKCQLTADDGTVSTGDYDFIPLLNSFLEAHPDFSYEGARATVAVSGYDGLFGYALDEAEALKPILTALKNDGYDLACYTYEQMEYADYGAVGIQEDLDKWTADIAPILGQVDILVYPTGGDIKGQEAYGGSKYDTLHAYGFRYFIGTGSGSSWGMTTSEYARQLRHIVSAVNLQEHPDWFTGLFDAATVLSSERS